MASQQKHIDRTIRELERFKANPHALAMMRGSAAALNGYERKLDSRKLQLSTREAPKGGRGRIVHGEHQTLILLHNREPHGRAQEKRNQTLAKAEAAARTGGLRRAGAAYLKTVVTASMGGAAQ